LYELTKAPPDKLKQAIDGDRVRPTMTGAEAKALVKELKARPPLRHGARRHQDHRRAEGDGTAGQLLFRA